MDPKSKQSIDSPQIRKSSLSNLKKCLSLYSDPGSPTDDNPFPLQAFNKTMPNALSKEILKESDSEDTFFNSQHQSISGDLNTVILIKFKRQNTLLRQENQNLLKEIQMLNKTLQARNDETSKLQLENLKLKKIANYVIEEILGEFKEIDCKEEILPFLVRKINMIKSTVINTQKAYFKQKELNKKLKSETQKLQNENFSNIELILKMNKYKEREERESFDLESELRSDKFKGETTEKKGSHRKSNSMFLDSVGKRELGLNGKGPGVFMGECKY